MTTGIGPDKSKRSKSNNYNLEKFTNSSAGTDPYNALGVPRCLVLEDQSKKRQNVQELCDKVKKGDSSKKQSK